MRDLTRGNISGNLVSFAIPIVLGNLFQLTYNAVDSIVIGRFAGDNALAAVSSADPIMNLLILGITGLCIGASVLMSNYFGEGDHEKLKQEFSTILALNGLIAILILLIGILYSEKLLLLVNVPEVILEQSSLYLKVILIGMPFTCFYNVYAAALRSIGDSRTPIRFLAFASVTNGIMDVIFVASLHMDVLGAAFATVISEFISALLCVAYVYRKVEILQIKQAHFCYNKELLRQTVRLGTTTALQQCSQPLGKFFIQGMVNTLGISTIAAFNAVGKIEDFALVPERSIGNAMMTFTAQNDGAGEKKRVWKGLSTGLTLEMFYFVMIGILIFLFKRPILMLFSTNEETLIEGSKYFGIMAFFYFLPGITNGMQGFFRGMKHMKITLVGTITQISFRVLFTWIFLNNLGITGIAFACAIGWIMMILLEVIYLKLKLLRRETHA